MSPNHLCNLTSPTLSHGHFELPAFPCYLNVSFPLYLTSPTYLSNVKPKLLALWDYNKILK